MLVEIVYFGRVCRGRVNLPEPWHNFYGTIVDGKSYTEISKALQDLDVNAAEYGDITHYRDVYKPVEPDEDSKEVVC